MMPSVSWISKYRMIINIVSFQILWWWCVLCGREGAGLLALSVVVLAFVAHLRWIETWADALPIMTIALVGCIFDQAMYHLQLVSFAKQASSAQWIPLWMAGLWLGFACTLNVSLKWLQGRWFLAFILGAIFGPLAYLGAEKLHAVILLEGYTTLILFAIGWGVLLPVQLRLRQLSKR